MAASHRKGPPVKRLLNDLLAYTPEDNSWVVLDDGTQDAPSRRKGVQLVSCQRENSLYLFGGAGPGIYYNDLWRFDLTEQRWYNESTKCLDRCFGDDVAYPHVRAYHVTEIYDDDSKLLVYGGYGVEDDEESLWEYDLKLASWRKLYTPHSVGPGMRFGLCACVYAGGLYIFTGQQRNVLVPQVLWRLDLKTGNYVWKQLATTGACPSQRTYAASLLLKVRPNGDAGANASGRWLIHGGSSADTVFNDAYELNLDALHWHPCVNLCTQPTIEGHTMTAVPTSWGSTSIFLLGGASSGPLFPKGPIARCDLFLNRWFFTPETANLTMEDFCIRLPAVSELIWELQRSVLKLEDSVNVLSANKSELEEENTRLHQLLKYHQRSPGEKEMTRAIWRALESAVVTLHRLEVNSENGSRIGPPLSPRLHEDVEDHMLLNCIAKLTGELTSRANAVSEQVHLISTQLRQQQERSFPHQEPSVASVGAPLTPVATVLNRATQSSSDRDLTLPRSGLRKCSTRGSVTRGVVCGVGRMKSVSPLSAGTRP